MARLSGLGDAPAVVHPWRITDAEGRALGTAWFDRRRVRSLEQTLMVAVDAEGRVQELAVLSFDEPLDYLPPERWWEQFHDRGLDDGLALGRGIHGVTGATLTGRATVAAVRETLALQRVLTPAPRP